MNRYILVFLFFSFSLLAQSGVFKSYFSKGKVSAEISRVEDVYDGTSYWFFENGNLKSEITYDDGVVNGWVREYYENGLLKYEYHVSGGVRDGEYREYHDNGALKQIVTYREGVFGGGSSFDYDSLYIASVDEFVGTKKYYEQRRKKELYICTVDVCPEPIGGMDAIYEKLVYPEHARLYGLEGEVMLSVFVNSKGFVTGVDVLKSLGLGADDAAINAVKETRFLPGKNDNRKVDASVTLKVLFDLNNPPASSSISRTSLAEITNPVTGGAGGEEGIKLYRNFDCEYEVCPQPEGGMQSLIANLYIPASAKRNNTNGEVIIEADVDKFGNVLDTKVLKGLQPGLDQSVEVAVLETRFTPASQGGNNIRAKVKIIVPIRVDN
ncbi:MAG: hypothetical protein SCALA702_29250 [Melioribacteraceae bacterium]|nr:MAG: hypothetical protein SCALA702_29250 [Melioribacteraceae bacterium]